MNFQELIVLLPCYSLEDLSLDRNRQEADELLSAWTALFHPRLLFAARQVPKWTRADDPPQDLAGKLVVVPPCCEALVPDEWLGAAERDDGCVLRNHRHRDELIAAATERLDEPHAEIDPSVLADFLALGFCHLQVELLTRQLRYMSNLDEVGFQREALAAAEAAVCNETQPARERLRGAFDLLTEAREYFYPVETYLLDLTLLAPTTLAAPLRAELSGGAAVNLLLSGRVLDEMARRRPETLAALRDALQGERATVIGGEFDEHELPLLPVEAILEDLQQGTEAYERHLECRPMIFGRRRFGLTPVLPQILSKLGFTGAVHFTLDGGRFPKGNQSKVRWQGLDSTAIEALVRVPLEASRPQTFLNLPEKLGDTMDLDHAATAVFAHWPGRASLWFNDLRRMAEYSPVLGRFVTAAKYFQDTEYVGQASKYAADAYRSPYLRQAVDSHEPDPVSRWVRYYRRRTAADALNGLRFLGDVLEGRTTAAEPEQSSARTLAMGPSELAGPALEPDQTLNDELREAQERISRCLLRGGDAATGGHLVLNPWCFARRVPSDLLGGDAAPSEGAAEPPGGQAVAVDVPGMGFAWVVPGGRPAAPPDPTGRQAKRRRKKEEPPLAEPHVLRNEFLEAQISPVTGAIQSIHDYVTRGSRLTGQIAFRFPPGDRPKHEVWGQEDAEGDYTIMAADELSVAVSGRSVGKIISRGRLMDREGGLVARFVQTATVRRGCRVLDLSIELDTHRRPGPDPWQSYYAARFAWGDATADVYRSVNQLRLPSEVAQIESPYFLDVRAGRTQTTLLTGGLPYHRRLGLRKLDTLLIVRGETARTFRLGIGIDVGSPLPAALDFLAPEHVLRPAAGRQAAASGWLFHVGAKNVLATHWEPVWEDARPAGFRVRLLETEGRRVRTGLRAFRTVQSAAKFDFQEKRLAELPVRGDRIDIDLTPYEWAQIEAHFAP